MDVVYWKMPVVSLLAFELEQPLTTMAILLLHWQKTWSTIHQTKTCFIISQTEILTLSFIYLFMYLQCSYIFNYQGCHAFLNSHFSQLKPFWCLIFFKVQKLQTLWCLNYMKLIQCKWAKIYLDFFFILSLSSCAHPLDWLETLGSPSISMFWVQPFFYYH